jgi:hypothetical protein
MSWARVSLFTNVTREPAGIVTVRGETLFAEIVIVIVPGVGLGEGEGAGDGDGVEDGAAGVEVPPPHPNPSTATAPKTHNNERTHRGFGSTCMAPIHP